MSQRRCLPLPYKDTYADRDDRYLVLIFKSKLAFGKPAHTWFCTLSDAQKVDWPTLRSAFLDKFATSPSTELDILNAMRSLTSFKRLPDETANSYIVSFAITIFFALLPLTSPLNSLTTVNANIFSYPNCVTHAVKLQNKSQMNSKYVSPEFSSSLSYSNY